MASEARIVRGEFSMCWITENTYWQPIPHKAHGKCPGYPIPASAYKAPGPDGEGGSTPIAGRAIAVSSSQEET